MLVRQQDYCTGVSSALKLRDVVLSGENRKGSILKPYIQCDSWVCSKRGLKALSSKMNPLSIVAGEMTRICPEARTDPLGRMGDIASAQQLRCENHHDLHQLPQPARCYGVICLCFIVILHTCLSPYGVVFFFSTVQKRNAWLQIKKANGQGNLLPGHRPARYHIK